MQRLAPSVLAVLLLAMGLETAVAANGEIAGAYTHTDRLIVRLKSSPGVSNEFAAADRAPQRRSLASRLQSRTRETLTPLRTMGDGAHIIQLDRRRPIEEMRAIAAQLAQDPDVLDVVPDRLFFPQLTPTDPQYINQWNLDQVNGINLPGAWDLTTGSNSLVIAVLDTGMLPHGDLTGRWIGGADFVSLAERSNDANLRDVDPTDPGDWVTAAESASGPLAGCPVTDSRWHGTAMAGIIAANSNNATGIAGINWNSKILPVRVVGKCGGYESDIVDGLRWAVGYAISGAPKNPNPVRVVNLSLAAGGACSTALQNAINDVLALNVTIVAAAGNNSADSGGYSPGNCSGVISVAAVDRNGGKPAYTNFGMNISVSAPGGLDGSNNSALNILTATNDGITTASANNDYYRTALGTSISAAQVTGIISLMLGVNPTLSPQTVNTILRNTSRVFPTNTTAAMPNPSQADCTVALCGAGIANALRAIQAAQLWGNATPMFAGGFQHGVALRADGVMFAWGGNGNGQFGNGPPVAPTYLPAKVVNISGVIKVAAGGYHTLALRADGTVWAWGSNGQGQLGDGTNTSRNTPAQVPGLTDIRDIGTSYFYSVAVKADGTVWTWGTNNNGQLGDGTTTSHFSPAPIASLTNVVSISAGQSHVLARKSDGSVWAWGNNSYGQLGDGTTTQRLTPVAASGLSNITAIAAGEYHSMALKADGSVWAWGYNLYGQSGDGTMTNRSLPAAVAGLSPVSLITAGHMQSLARKNDGTVWAWGRNHTGQLGDGTLVDRLLPVQIAGLANVSALATAGGGGDMITNPNGFSFALNGDGFVYAWGNNSYGGQLGDGTSQMRPAPTMMLTPAGTAAFNLNVTSASFAPVRAAVINSVQVSNPVYIDAVEFGSAISVSGGEYQINGGAFTSAPGAINGGSYVTLRQTAASACDVTTTMTVTIDAVVREFKVTTACDTTPNTFSFQLYAGALRTSVRTSNVITISGINVPTPISVAGGEYSIGCTAVFTSLAGTVVNGQTVCVRQTASNGYDTQTNATLTVGTASAAFPVITLAGPGFSAAPMLADGLALRADGTVFAWGSHAAPLTISGVIKVARGMALRSDGTVWILSSNSSVAPIQVAGLTGITDIAASDSFIHYLARKSDGTLWAWGDNSYGQLGDGTTTPRTTPAIVPMLSNVIAVAAGIYRSMALKGDGTVWSWGLNFNGQLGDGTNMGRLAPTLLTSLANVIAIAAGGYHSLALKGDGTVWSWGYNGYGQLGDGTVTQRNLPEPVPGLAGIAKLAAGSNSSFAITANGAGFGWGRNIYGELGNGSLNNQLAPVSLAGLSHFASIVSAGTRSSAIDSDSSIVWSWGNGFNSLGTGTTSGSYPNPAMVLIAGELRPLFLNVTTASFAPAYFVGLGSIVVSNPVFATGIANGSSITVTGGEYQIDGGAFTSLPGTINAGQLVTLRRTAAAVCNTNVTVTVSIAGVNKTFNVSTGPCTTTPYPFEFLLQPGVAVSTVRVSNTITVGGINVPAPISITGGEYSIGCTAAFTAAAGSISNGQTVCVRQTASAMADSVTQAILTIGTVSSTFTVITATAPGFSATPMLAGGYLRAMGVRSDGMLFAWGNNSSGQLGTGSLTYYPVGIPQQALLGGVVHTAAAYFHSLALRADGTVWAWGDNSYGQLGDGTNLDRLVPFKVAGLTGVVEVAAAGDHSLARKSDGTVWSWGKNTNGQLGDGTTTNRSTPMPIAGLANVMALAAGNNLSLALKNDGTVWTFGIDGTATPAQVPMLGNVIAIKSGSNHSLALKNDGSVWAWGANNRGQLGDGGVSDPIAARTVPVQVTGLTGVSAVAAGTEFSLALKSDGSVWAWGFNQYGALGDGTTLNRTTPVKVLGISGISAIAAGSYSYALSSDGAVFSWPSGQGSTSLQPSSSLVPPPAGIDDDALRLIGFGTRPAFFSLPLTFDVSPGATVTAPNITITGLGTGIMAAIAVAGGEYSINGGAFVASPGTVVNGDAVAVRVVASASFSTTTLATLIIGGVSGRTSTFYVRTRRDANATAIIPQVALGSSHTYLLNSSGSLYAVGYNGNGQLGNGTTYSTPVLSPVAGLGRIVAIASGANHGLALRADGTVAAWGYNNAGQLGAGLGSNYERYFVNISGLANVVAIAAGDYHSLALKGDGSVWAWGLNVDGQVGTGTATSTYFTPVQVTGVGGTGTLAGVTAIGAGSRHSLAVLANGSVVAWGANPSGQLGDNSTTSRTSPVAVSTLTSGVLAVSAGGSHSLALKTDATVVAWGDNSFGQLGDGTSMNRQVPVAIPGLVQIGRIAAGASHSLAIRAGGQLYTWGNNANSQLGDGEVGNRNAPFLVAVPSNISAIAGGGRHSAAINNTGKLFIWGDNYFGQVGNKSGNYNPHSANLNVLRGDSQISTYSEDAGSSNGTNSSSGSAVIEIAEVATGYDFKTLTLGNTGAALGKFKNQATTSDISSIGISVTGPGFSVQSTDCPGTLPAGTECNFALAFTPPVPGDAVGELLVASNLTGSPERRSLFGTGIPPATPGMRVNATAGDTYLAFAPQTVGTSSTAANVTITNTGSAPLVISGTSVTTGSSHFNATSACTTTIAAGATCTLPVTFAPAQASSIEGQLTLAGNAGTQIVTLSGTGVGSAGVNTVPSPPAIQSVVPGNGQLTVNFTAPASNGGLPITGYTVTCNPGNVAVAGMTSPIVVTGLTNGTAYTCSLTAENAIGSSSASATVTATPSPTPTLTLIAAVSRKTHAGLGPIDHPIDLSKAITEQITVEPRGIGAGHVIVFQFNQPIAQPGTATVVDAMSANIGNIAGINAQGNDVQVTLTDIPDRQRVTVSLTGVNGSGSAQVSIGFLVGDVTNNLAVNAGDISAVKARVGQMVNSTATYRFDLNASGTIDARDVLMVKARAGWVLP